MSSEKTSEHYELKKQLITSIKNLTIVTVSNWLDEQVRKSFMRNHRICKIYNGVDMDAFKPTYEPSVLEKYGLSSVRYLVGVAKSWSDRKGLKDYIQLSKVLDNDVRIVLVGLTKAQIADIKDTSIIGIQRTESVYELSIIYSKAEIVLNLSYEETFGLTTVEGMSCGTPGIVYNLTASPELVSKDTGRVVPAGNVPAIVEAIQLILKNGKNYYSEACIKRVDELFDKNKCYKAYLELYQYLLYNSKK